MSRLAPRPLSEALSSLTDTLRPATTLARVQSVWEASTGAAIALAARPSAERDGVLTITCSASVWAHELDLMADELIPRLNEQLGEQAIRELRCRTA